MLIQLLLGLDGLLHRSEGEAEAAVASARLPGQEAWADQHLLLQRQLARLHLHQIAALEILIERTGVTEAQILAKVEEIDLRDGKADGRLVLRPAPCPACRRPSHSERSHCIYCGAALTPRLGRNS